MSGFLFFSRHMPSYHIVNLPKNSAVHKVHRGFKDHQVKILTYDIRTAFTMVNIAGL
jgi:hypothetical protein